MPEIHHRDVRRIDLQDHRRLGTWAWAVSDSHTPVINSV